MKVQLREHEQIHNSWVCEQCGIKFKYEQSLKNHVKHRGSKNCRKRKQPKESSNGLISTEERLIINVQRPFSCNKCSYRAAKKYTLVRHKFHCPGKEIEQIHTIFIWIGFIYINFLISPLKWFS